MNNKQIIAETSRIEGDSYEYLNMWAFKQMGMEYIDVSGNPEYQKKDIDLQLLDKNKTTIEIKSDYRALGTGNLPFEIVTHLDPEVGKIYEEYFKLHKDEQYVTLEYALSLVANARYSIGCNLKCQADFVYYFFAEEEGGIDKSKKYRLGRLLGFGNEKLKAYFQNPQNKFKIRFVYQKEDRCYNIILLEKIDKLVALGLGKEPSKAYMDAIRSLKDADGYDVFSKYRSSEEMSALCQISKDKD